MAEEGQWVRLTPRPLLTQKLAEGRQGADGLQVGVGPGAPLVEGTEPGEGHLQALEGLFGVTAERMETGQVIPGEGIILPARHPGFEGLGGDLELPLGFLLLS